MELVATVKLSQWTERRRYRIFQRDALCRFGRYVYKGWDCPLQWPAFGLEGMMGRLPVTVTWTKSMYRALSKNSAPPVEVARLPLTVLSLMWKPKDRTQMARPF